MKANEAPEKIYINPNIEHRMWLIGKGDTSIEYTRTDAFMEKTKEWIKNNVEKFVVNTPMCNYYDYKRAVENFENYIKGE